MSRMRIVGCALVLFALALSASTAHAASSEPEVTVFGEAEQPIAYFKTAKCKKGKAFFHAEAFSTDRQYELDAFIRGFSGFHKYDVTLGSTNPNILFDSVQPSAPIYGNQFQPSFPVPGFGQINFSAKGKRMGIGFGPAMWSEDGSTAVVLAGGLECKYPKKRR
jgi:hypothetical protein